MDKMNRANNIQEVLVHYVDDSTLYFEIWEEQDYEIISEMPVL